MGIMKAVTTLEKNVLKNADVDKVTVKLSDLEMQQGSGICLRS